MEDAGIFAKQLAEKVEEARIALGKKDETHAAEITSKDIELKSRVDAVLKLEEELNIKVDELKSKEESHAAELETKDTSATAKEAYLSAQLAASEERHAAALQVKKRELEESRKFLAETNGSMAIMQIESENAEKRHAAALKAKEDAHTKALDVERTLTRDAIAELQSEKSKTVKLGSDLIGMSRVKVVICLFFRHMCIAHCFRRRLLRRSWLTCTL